MDNEKQDPQLIQVKGIPSEEAFGTPMIRIKHHLWISWARIAIEQEGLSLVARQLAENLKTKGSNGLSDQIEKESNASMIAISASAHSLDAFYGAIQKHVGVPLSTKQAWDKNKTPRHRRILETLKLGFALGKEVSRWTTELEWLFDLRDSGLHFEEDFRDPSHHPLGTNTATEMVEFGLENAGRAIDLLLAVLETCMSSAGKESPALVSYAGDMKWVLDDLRVRRSETR